MADWNDLFKWSKSGTKPTGFREMTKEDREWLANTIQNSHYKYYDLDRL